MTALTIRLPESLHKEIKLLAKLDGVSINQFLTLAAAESLHKETKLLAKLDGVSINQFLTLAAAEKVSALRTIEYLREQGEQGNRADFEAWLAAVPSVDPAEDDRL